jgi:signal transduction histidine kinase
VSVQDTGLGIPNEEREAIFEPFKQLENVKNKHRPGYGLGLAITRDAIEALGGRVELASEVNHGSCFTAVLPPLAAEQASREERVREQKNSLHP